jgi:glycosyltransferase 2 family protein
VRRRFVAVAAWAIGLGLVVALVDRIGTDALWSTLRGVRLGMLWVIAAGFAGIAASALPWRLLLPADVRPGVGAAVASRTAAAGLNAVLPLLSVGDVSRLLWIERRAWAHGLAAMAVERLLFALVSGVSVAAGAVAAALLPQLPARFVPAAAGAALLIAMMSLGGLWVAARRAPLTALLRWGLRLRAAVAKLSSARAVTESDIQEVQLDEALRSILGGPRGPLAGALALHLLARVLFTLEIYAALRALGVSPDLPTTLCLAAVPVALSLAAVVLPSQIGVQEGSQAALTAALGLGAPLGLAMTLLMRARLLLTVPIGALCFLLRKRR